MDNNNCEYGMLHHILSSEDFSLALSPGFYRFYAHIGILHALEELNCLNVSHVSGSSAGALVGGFLASGMKPSEMISLVLSIQRRDIWDSALGFGLLKGELFQSIIEKFLPVKTFEECKIPLGITVFDIFRFQTRSITTGNIALAVRTSCTFPIMFQPAMIDGRPHIDGGVFDDAGIMALPYTMQTLHSNNCVDNNSKSNDNKIQSQNIHDDNNRQEDVIEEDNNNSTVLSFIEACTAAKRHMFKKLVVNIVFERSRITSSVLPDGLHSHKLLTIAVDNIPNVNPFTMNTMSVVAYKTAKLATLKALKNSHMQELSPNHWCCYIDGAGITIDSTLINTITNNNNNNNTTTMLLPELNKHATSTITSSASNTSMTNNNIINVTTSTTATMNGNIAMKNDQSSLKSVDDKIILNRSKQFQSNNNININKEYIDINNDNDNNRSNNINKEYLYINNNDNNKSNNINKEYLNINNNNTLNDNNIQKVNNNLSSSSLLRVNSYTFLNASYYVPDNISNLIHVDGDDSYDIASNTITTTTNKNIASVSSTVNINHNNTFINTIEDDNRKIVQNDTIKIKNIKKRVKSSKKTNIKNKKIKSK